MFERYTERARRMLFFARYEASQFGSISIELEHLLLGLLREPGGVVGQMLDVRAIAPPDIRGQIEKGLNRRGQSGSQAGAPMFPVENFAATGMSLPLMCAALEDLLDRPVVDETGLTGVFDVTLQSTARDRAAFIDALRDEAGLVLTPARREISMWIVTSGSDGSG